jgi:hypothetical protein
MGAHPDALGIFWFAWLPGLRLLVCLASWPQTLMTLLLFLLHSALIWSQPFDKRCYSCAVVCKTICCLVLLEG